MLFFAINFCYSFLRISSWFNTNTVAAYWKRLLSFLLTGFIKNLYIIHHDSDLPYDIYNTINERNWRQTYYL